MAAFPFSLLLLLLVLLVLVLVAARTATAAAATSRAVDSASAKAYRSPSCSTSRAGRGGSSQWRQRDARNNPFAGAILGCRFCARTATTWRRQLLPQRRSSGPRGGGEGDDGTDAAADSSAADFSSTTEEDSAANPEEPTQPTPPSSATSSPSSAASLLDRVRLRLGTIRGEVWLVPIVGACASFTTFPQTSRLFHSLVQRWSSNTWIPSSPEDVTLQANVVTQVVNGPVITSVSVLFATLVTITVSNLHARQVEIRASIVREVQALRELERLAESSASGELLASSSSSSSSTELAMIRACVQIHADQLLLREVNSKGRTWNPVGISSFSDTESSSPTSPEGSTLDDPHAYIESDLMILQDVINEMRSSIAGAGGRGRRGGGIRRPASPATAQAIEHLLTQLQDLTHRLLAERTNRWLAMKALNFPAVHYATLALLALSIGVAFLVATDEAEFIFLHGLPVRILWTLLCTSFTALAVLCYDLSRPFGGAYRVSGR